MHGTALLLVLTLSTSLSRAEPPPGNRGAPVHAAAPGLAPDGRSIEPGVWPTLSALGPGLVLHGAGTFMAGDRRTAKRLFIGSLVGFSTFFVSGALLAGTGTARGLVGIATPFVIAGGGTFLLSWLADIYGASTGGRDVLASPFLPQIEAELGYRYVYDPQFAYRNFAEARSHFRFRSFRASPSAIVALDDDNQRFALELGKRLRGRVPGEPSRDGSYLETAGSLTYHRFGRERFSVWTPALALEGRLDLAHAGTTLRGAFVEGHVGAGLELYNFDVQGLRARESSFALLLARFAFGVYLRGSGVRGGEATIYYDHRHDDYAAGLGVRGIGSGVLGHLGAAGHYYFSEHWGGALVLEVGSAVVTSLTLRYRRRQP
jgi:hypothetical protein